MLFSSCCSPALFFFFFFFFFNDTATTEIYTLSLHDALPIFELHRRQPVGFFGRLPHDLERDQLGREDLRRSEEHTSELQSRPHLVCRLLLEKKKKTRDKKKKLKKKKRRNNK